MLTAEIIAIGSELLAPTRTDTNSLWLTEQLNRIGIDVKLKTIVGDDDARLEEAIRDAVKRSRVVITTGGLGPTEDDVTRKVAARALGRRLVLDDRVLREIRTRFAQYKLAMPERNSRQAMVIDGAEVLDNPNGSAPGLFIEHEGCAIALLPGQHVLAAARLPLNDRRPKITRPKITSQRDLSPPGRALRRP